MTTSGLQPLLGDTFGALRRANISRNQELTGGVEVPLTYRATEWAGETGEACNVVKKLERERFGWKGSRATTDDLADEVADAIICADLLCMTAGIDLWAAVVRKFNNYSEKIGLATRLAAHSPSQAALDVAAERRRQVELEGWSPEHDDEHGNGEMAKAAACYAVGTRVLIDPLAPRTGALDQPIWPWSSLWWKPDTRRRELVKAAALLVAEIERLDRLGS